MRNTTIKTKLILFGALSALGLGILLLLLNSNINNLHQLDDAQRKVQTLKSNMLTLKRNETDFLLRKDTKYKEKFQKIPILYIKMYQR